jgi:hypothetical protein
VVTSTFFQPAPPVCFWTLLPYPHTRLHARVREILGALTQAGRGYESTVKLVEAALDAVGTAEGIFRHHDQPETPAHAARRSDWFHELRNPIQVMSVRFETLGPWPGGTEASCTPRQGRRDDDRRGRHGLDPSLVREREPRSGGEVIKSVISSVNGVGLGSSCAGVRRGAASAGRTEGSNDGQRG